LKRRQAWFEGQLDLDPERLVFIDETWASTTMPEPTAAAAAASASASAFRTATGKRQPSSPA
jgi:hypothetical protein